MAVLVVDEGAECTTCFGLIRGLFLHDEGPGCNCTILVSDMFKLENRGMYTHPHVNGCNQNVHIMSVGVLLYTISVLFTFNRGFRL